VFVFPHGPYVGVEFDDVGLDNAGHSINGLAADGHGWNLTYEELDLVKEPPAPSSQELAWFDYCDQLEGKLSRTEEEAKNLFLAGWEAAKGGGP